MTVNVNTSVAFKEFLALLVKTSVSRGSQSSCQANHQLDILEKQMVSRRVRSNSETVKWKRKLPDEGKDEAL